MSVDPMDVVCLIFILLGVILIVIAQILKHKGIWDFHEAHKEWALKDLHSPASPRGFDSPYQVTYMGAVFIAIGALTAVYSVFGLKPAAWAFVGLSAVGLAFGVARLKRVDRGDNSAYAASVAAVIVTVCALLLGLWVLALI